jgi:hypothetical protein
MLFKRINRDNAETCFIVVKNVSGSTMTAGYSAVFDTSASVDGVRVTQASAGDLAAFAGVIDADLADSAYGLCQVYGYRASAYLNSSTGSSAVGDVLSPLAASWGLTPSATSGTSLGVGFLCEALAASSSSRYNTTKKVFIRAL